MTSFKDYIKLYESFDSPVNISHRDKNILQNDIVYRSFFLISDKKYILTIEENRNISLIHVYFSRFENNKEIITNTNDLDPKEVMSLFSTVILEVKRFKDKDIIYFSTIDSKKKSLYKNIASKIVGKLDDRTLLIEGDDFSIVKNEYLTFKDKAKLFVDSKIEKLLKKYKRI